MTIEQMSNRNKQRSKPSDEQERSDDEIMRESEILCVYPFSPTGIVGYISISSVIFIF